MSSKIYWAAIATRTWGKNVKMFPMTFHHSAHEAGMDCMRRNNSEKTLKHPRKWEVQRFVMEFKEKAHYDIYKHEWKRI
jgi:hypothetical protein